MPMRWLRAVVVLAVTAGFAVLTVSPASAVDDLVWQNFDYACSETAGQRTAMFVIWPPVDQVNGQDVAVQTGIVTALSISAPHQTVVGYPITPVGSILGKETLSDGRTRTTTASGRFIVGPGPTSVTVSMSVHWDDFRGTGSQNLTTTRTLALGACQPVPLVTFASQCSGMLLVNYANGDYSHRAGGTATFEVLGADGYSHRTSYAIRPNESFMLYVPPYAAKSVIVKANNVEVARGAYVAAPGCVGYVGQPGAPGSGGGQSGGQAGGGNNGGAGVAAGGGNSGGGGIGAGTTSVGDVQVGPGATGVATGEAPGASTVAPSESPRLLSTPVATRQLAAEQGVSANRHRDRHGARSRRSVRRCGGPRGTAPPDVGDGDSR